MDNKGDKTYIQHLRYCKGKNTEYQIYQELKSTDVLIESSIIPMNVIKNVQKYDFDIEFYFQFARHHLGQNENSWVEKTRKKKNLPVENVINEIKKFVHKYANDFDIIPMYDGKYPVGRLQENTLKTDSDLTGVSTVCLLMSKTTFFVLDVDSSTKFPEKVKDYLKKNVDCYTFCYHSNEDLKIQDVIQSYRFKVIFKSSESIYNKLENLIKNYAHSDIEIEFSKAYALCGLHRFKSSEYKIVGTSLHETKFPSEELMDLIVSNKPKITKAQLKDHSLMICRNIN